MVIWKTTGRSHEQLKQRVTTSGVLKYYDQSLTIRISCDASMLGLGAVLEQKHNDD